MKVLIFLFLILNLYKILFFLTTIIGTLIAISSYSWLRIWIGLEINLLSIIPLLKDRNNIFPSESALKYFITQSLASRILLLSIILSLNLKEFFIENFQFLTLIINSALLTKIGAAPFHAWFPEVMEGLNWITGLLILTWQKIAPIILIFYRCNLRIFFLLIILISTIFRGILGLNQIRLRKILTYSSINHISWILARILYSQVTWIIYFSIYSLITFNIVIIFNFLKIFYLNQLFSSLNYSKSLKFSFLLNFLSLGGLPPFLGFFPKWLVINNLILNKFYFLRLLLILFTLITLFFYLRICFSTIILNTKETLIYIPKKLNFKIFLINFISLRGLLICTLILNYV